MNEPVKTVVTKRKSAVIVPVRFEFEIPENIPEENKMLYVHEKAKKLCEHLSSKKGCQVQIQRPAA